MIIHFVFALGAFIVTVESLSKCTHIHEVDISVKLAGRMFLRNDGFLRGVHAAYRRTVLIAHEVPRANALQERNTSGLPVVGRSDQMPAIGTRSTQHSLELRRRHNICKTLIVVFEPVVRVIPIKTGRQYDRSDMELDVLSLLLEVDGLGVTDGLACSAVSGLKVDTAVPVDRWCVRNGLRECNAYHRTRPHTEVKLGRKWGDSPFAKVFRLDRAGRADKGTRTTAHAKRGIGIKWWTNLSLNAAIRKVYYCFAHALLAHSHAKAAENTLLILLVLFDARLSDTHLGRYRLDFFRPGASGQQQF